MLTGLGDVDSRVRALEAGADDYLVKPFDPTEINARVRSLLQRFDMGGAVRDNRDSRRPESW